MHAGPGAARPTTRSSGTTRASPTTPCGRSTTTSSRSRSSTGSWWDTYVRVNQRFAEAAAARRAPRAHRLGARLPAAAGAGACCRELRPDLRIGFFLHIPFPPRRAVHASCPGATADRRGPARRRPRRLPARRRRRRTSSGCAERLLDLTAHATGRCLSTTAATVAGRRLPDLASTSSESTRWPRTPEVAGRAPSRSATSSATRRIVLLGVDRLDYTKGIAPAAAAPSSGCSSDGARRAAEHRCWCRSPRPSRERVEHYQQHARRGRAAGRRDQRRASAASATRRCTTCTSPAARGARARCTRRRRHGRDAAARRDEPRRQGVRRLPRSTATACWCFSEFAGAADELQRARCWSTRTTSTGVKSCDARADRAEPVEERGRRMRSMRKQVRDHDIICWADAFLADLGAGDNSAPLTATRA